MTPAGYSQKPRALPGKSPETAVAFSYSAGKVSAFAMMLFLVMGIGLLRLWQAPAGEREDLVATAMLLIIPGYMLYMLLRDLRLASPVLRLDASGIRDQRHKAGRLIAWQELREATIRRRVLLRGIRVELTDGKRIDLDMTLLNGRPADAMRFIQQMADRAPADETAGR